LVVVPLLVVGWFAIWQAGGALERQAQQAAQTTAQSLAEMIQMVLLEEIKLVKDLAVGNATIKAADKVVKDGVSGSKAELDDLSRKFKNAVKDIGEDYEVIVFVDPNGVVVADSVDGKNIGIDVKDRDYFQQVKAKKAPVVGQPTKSKGTGNPVVAVAAPVPVPGGQFAGAVAVIMKLDAVGSKISTTKLGSTGYCFMADKNGIAIAHPDKKVVMELNIKTLAGAEDLAAKMLGGGAGIVHYAYKGEAKVAGFAPVPLTGWSVAATQLEDEFQATPRAIRDGVGVIGLVFLALAMGGIWFFVRNLTKPINRVVSGLSEAADQVTSAAGEVSGASNQLAQGSSSQAASLEETSASLEELSSMTRTNADNAQQANTLTSEASRTMEGANTSMTDLTRSMGEITRASEEISKIIKTIDEIAFQTNLLALNAAVEAARAGEAGAGFAVVAEEVRNLAMRAGEAAKNTAGLIEGTVAKIKGGAQLVDRTNTAFGEMAASTRKVAELVGEIAAASAEQAQGLDQINKALTQMDKVTQGNAATAEETASASEQMNAQASHMKEFVADLVAVVGGSAGLREPRQRKRRDKAKKEKPRPAREARPRALPAPARAKTAPPAARTAPGKQRPEDIIPMDDGDFKDF
jgi:methyl-accepting chemotaxis protein